MTQSRSSSSLAKMEHHGEPSERLHGVHSTTKMYMHNTHAENEDQIEPPNIIASQHMFFILFAHLPESSMKRDSFVP